MDVIKQLVDKLNPLPLLAVIDQIDLYTRTEDGVPLFNLLMNKFLPLSDLLENLPIKFEADADGRTPLHYAVEADDVKAV
jgi:ankyrin repeat protein